MDKEFESIENMTAWLEKRDSGDFWKPKTGKNKVKFTSDPTPHIIEFNDRDTGEPKKLKGFVMNLIDLNGDPEVELRYFSASVQIIQKLHSFMEENKNIKGRTFVIDKSGDGVKTKYDVTHVLDSTGSPVESETGLGEGGGRQER